MTSMGPPRSPVLPPTTLNSPVKTAHSLAILSEYTHTLDSVPLELSRNFADLRELDAVLSSSMTVVTSKVVELTNLIENRAASREDRLWLLADIADLISKLKPGAEDKIRVACHAADSLRGHRTHMSNLLQHMPEPEYGAMAGMLSRKTVYPHVATRSYVPAGMPGEGGRRQRRTALLTNSGAMEATPHKRKRLVGDDGEVLAKSPVKPKLGESTRARNGARKKNDRATSPAESILSVASHLPQSALPQPISRQNTSQRGASASSTVKRARGQANTDDSRQEFNHPPSSHHPSLPAPFSNGVNETGKTRNTVGDWVTGELEGPGMPVARPFVNSGAASVAPDVDTDGGAANGEGDADIDDGRTYCYCERVSFGEMIACDDSNCEREWFHLACIGLAVAPEGSWICDTCQARRNAKRSGRGGKRRAGGGRAGARNAT